MFLCAAVKQHNNHKPQQSKGDVAVNAPGEGRVRTEPLVLGHHAQGDTHAGQTVHGGGQAALAGDVVALPPDVVEQYIEYRHGDGGDPFTNAQGDGVVLQTGGAEGESAGDQVEGITGPQHHRHPAEQTVLRLAAAVADHQNSDGDDRNEINSVK